MDADKEGFLRSERSLIQTIGRAARNSNGRVIMYADHMTDSMQKAIDETNRRRNIQEKYNKEHGITPKTIIKEITNPINISTKESGFDLGVVESTKVNEMSTVEKNKLINTLEKQMKKAAQELNFEEAMMLRDMILELKVETNGKKSK